MEFADFFKKYGIRFLVSLAVGVIIFLIYYLRINNSLVGSCDGLFIGGMICFAAGTLSIVTNLELTRDEKNDTIFVRCMGLLSC